MECYTHIKEEYEKVAKLIREYLAKYGRKRIKLAERLIRKDFKDKYGVKEKFEGASLLKEFEEEYFGIQYAE